MILLKTIAFDVDGVLADLCTNWLRWYNRDYNDNLKPSDITAWNTDQFVKPECGKNIYKYLDDPHLYDDVLPTAGAQDTIKRLKKLGFRIVYATTSPIKSSGRKFTWLKDYGFIDELKDYIEITDKSLIRASGLIDDKPGNLDNFEGKKILFSQPWNRSQRYNVSYLYAENWTQVLFYCLEEYREIIGV